MILQRHTFCCPALCLAAAAFCRTSAYQLSGKIIEANKAKMISNCKGETQFAAGISPAAAATAATRLCFL